MVMKTLEYFSRGVLFGMCFYIIFIHKLNAPFLTKLLFGLTLTLIFGLLLV